MMTRKTLLVVDDDPDIAEVLREALVDAGYRALIAVSLDTARDILGAFRIDLVITDAYPPDASGDRWSALRSLVDAARDTPLILCSAHNPERYADYAARGFAAYLPKPFDLDDLLALVASLLGTGGRSVPRAVPGQPAMQ